MATKTDIQDAISEVIRGWYFHHANTASEQDAWEAGLDVMVVNNVLRKADTINVIKNNNRNQLSANLAQASLRSALRPLLLEYAELLSITTTDEQEIITQINFDLVANSQSVQTRTIAFDLTSTPGGSNVGDGDIIRLTIDHRNQEIESTLASELITATIVEDQNSGNGASRHREIWLIEGVQSKTDNLGRWEFTQSGESSRMQIVSEIDEGLIRNGSFTDFVEVSGVLQGDNADGTPNGLAFWTMQDGTATNLSIQDSDVATPDDYFYVNIDEILQPASLEISGIKYIEQALNITQIDFDRPYLPMVFFRGDIGSAGLDTIIITWGSKSQSFAYGGGGGWILMAPDRDADLWPINWADGDQPKLRINRSTFTAGSFFIDSVFFVPGIKFNNTWMFPYPGQTPFQKDDTLTWADSETGSIVQRGFAFAHSRHLRHSGAPTRAEPLAL